MALANGKNYKIDVPPSLLEQLVPNATKPTDMGSVKAWTEYGREVAKEVKRLSSHPDVTLDELVSKGFTAVPQKYAHALLQEASKNRIALGPLTNNEYRITATSKLWSSLTGDYISTSLAHDAGGNGVNARHLGYALRDVESVMGNRGLIMSELRKSRPPVVPVAVEHPISETQRRENMASFIAEFQSSLTLDDNPLSLLEILPHGTRASRTWGSEVEAVSAHGVYPPKGWKATGDGSLRRVDDPVHDPDCIRMMPETSTYVIRDSDDKIVSDTRYCSCGLETGDSLKEFVSPILHSYHSKGLEYLTTILGARSVNSSPGMHIHVSAMNAAGKVLNPSQVASLLYGYNLLEPLWSSEYGREDGSQSRWAKPHGSETLYRYAKKSKSDKLLRDAPAMDYEGVDGDRYYAVNVLSLRKHGTVEFRAMGPRYEYEHMIRWAHFCREMVNLAEAGVTVSQWRKVRSFRDLLLMFAKYGKETPMPSWASTITPEQFVAEHQLATAGAEH